MVMIVLRVEERQQTQMEINSPLFKLGIAKSTYLCLCLQLLMLFLIVRFLIMNRHFLSYVYIFGAINLLRRLFKAVAGGGGYIIFFLQGGGSLDTKQTKPVFIILLDYLDSYININH